MMEAFSIVTLFGVTFAFIGLGLPLFGVTFAFIGLGLHFGTKYIDRMLGPPRS